MSKALPPYESPTPCGAGLGLAGGSDREDTNDEVLQRNDTAGGCGELNLIGAGADYSGDLHRLIVIRPGYGRSHGRDYRTSARDPNRWGGVAVGTNASGLRMLNVNRDKRRIRYRDRPQRRIPGPRIFPA